MSIDTTQLFAEEQWILNTIRSIKVQINALEIEKLHLENLVTQHTKIPAELYLASIRDEAAEAEPSTSLEAMELEPEQDDEFLMWPQLNLNVHAPGPSFNFMEEVDEEEEDDDDEEEEEDDEEQQH